MQIRINVTVVWSALNASNAEIFLHFARTGTTINGKFLILLLFFAIISYSKFINKIEDKEMNQKKSFDTSNLAAETKRNRVITLIFLIAGLFTVLYGVVSAIIHRDFRVGSTMIGYGAVAIVLAFLPFLLEKTIGLRINTFVCATVFIFIFLSLNLGSGFQWYVSVSWWDIFAHTMSGVIFTLFPFAFVSSFLEKTNVEHKIACSFAVAVCVSFAIAFLWEIFEFACDSLIGGNAQKFIPMDERFYNGGNSFAPLFGEDRMIADFFRSPAGYRYALMDTMEDMLCCLFGTMAFVAFAAIASAKKCSFFRGMIYVLPRKGKNSDETLPSDGEEKVEI